MFFITYNVITIWSIYVIVPLSLILDHFTLPKVTFNFSKLNWYLI